jgi:hypothetical protein
LNLSSALTALSAATRAGPTVTTSRVQALLGMLKVNQSIHTIHVFDLYREHELFRGSVIHYLETNRLRPRLLAIQKARPISYRAKVLGRALFAARSYANSCWMLLSGNGCFSVENHDDRGGCEFPTPASTAANVAAVAATAPTTGAACAINVSAIDMVTVPSVVEKRKAPP